MGMDVPTCPTCGGKWKQRNGRWSCPTPDVCKKILLALLEVERLAKKVEKIDAASHDIK